jgi:putative glutamine transport system substrate-binding protein
LKKLFFILALILVFVTTGCIGRNAHNKVKPQYKPELNTYEKILQRGTLEIATVSTSKPMCWKDSDGVLKGFEVDLGKEIAKRILGNPEAVKFIEITGAGRTDAVNSGTADIVIATMTINPQRKIFVDFSEPYYIASMSVLVPGNSKISTVADLNGKRLGVISGTTGEKSALTFAPNAQIIAEPAFDMVIDDLKKGKTDALINDDIMISFYMNEFPEGYHMLPLKLTVEPYGIAFKKTEDQTLKNSIDLVLSDIRNDGTLKNLKDKWNIK